MSLPWIRPLYCSRLYLSGTSVGGVAKISVVGLSDVDSDHSSGKQITKVTRRSVA